MPDLYEAVEGVSGKLRGARIRYLAMLGLHAERAGFSLEVNQSRLVPPAGIAGLTTPPVPARDSSQPNSPAALVPSERRRQVSAVTRELLSLGGPVQADQTAEVLKSLPSKVA
jgi:hypothetical protein